MLNILLPLGLAFIMFSLGLGLGLADFRRAFARPRAVLLGLLAQMVLLPLTALLIALSLDLSPTASVGLMILAASPGGVTAGIVTFLARGETALSISLSALTSLLAFISVPLIVGGSLRLFLDDASAVPLPVGQLVGGLVVVTLVPVALGLWLSESGRVGAKARSIVQRLATAVFAAIVIFTFVHEWDAIVTYLPILGPACLLLNIVTMTTGAALGRAAGLTPGGQVALSMECGIQNSALGITLALSLLQQPELAVPSVIYAVVMNLTAVSVILWRRRATAGSAVRQGT
jgi:BASS family bile acid:Na+ symporter